MSMRNYAVQAYCFMLTDTELFDLLKKYKGTNQNIDIENVKEIIENEDYYGAIEIAELLDFCYYGDIDGEFTNLNDNTYKMLDEECIVILYLDKDTLYKSYKNEDEVYEEILCKLKDFDIDKQYVIEHTGMFSGVYCG